MIDWGLYGRLVGGGGPGGGHRHCMAGGGGGGGAQTYIRTRTQKVTHSELRSCAKVEVGVLGSRL